MSKGVESPAVTTLANVQPAAEAAEDADPRP